MYKFSGKERHLSSRLLIWVVLCSSFFTLIVTAIQLFIDYKRDIQQIHTSLSFIKDSQLKPLTITAYNMDTKQLKLMLQGMLNIQDVEYLEISETSGTGKTILAQLGDPDSAISITKDFLLKYPSAPAGAVQFAVLHIGVSLDGIYNRLWDKAIIILLSNAAKTFVASLFIFYIFQTLVTRHLVNIANYTKMLDINCLDLPLKLNRKKLVSEGSDEFDRLTDAINYMRETLAIDIKDRKQAEDRLDLALKATESGAWDWNIATGEIIFDRNWLNMVGCEPGELGASIASWEKLVHDEDLKNFKQKLAEHLEDTSDSIYEYKYRIKKKNGLYMWSFARGKVIERNENGKPMRMIGIDTNITLRKQQDEQLRRSQKMNALGKLTGGIAHDYNNILGIILGYSELITQNANKCDKVEQYSKTILHTAERGGKLTKKLLAFSRQNQTDVAVISINQLLKEQKDLLEKTLTAQLELQLELQEELWLVEVDIGDLENTIFNVSINALHAMGNGGQLIISTGNIQLNRVEAEPLRLKVGEYVLLSFTDTGSGMNESTKERIFDPFYTTKGDQGTGLGLSQVYGFIERSQGAIGVYSELGHGSCFKLYFPRSHQQITKRQINIIEVPKDLHGTESVLVVDDEQSMVEFVNDILTKQGYHVLKANSAQQAFTILEKEKVELIISDVIMPNVNGYQFATQVRKLYPSIKIQMVSGFADKHDTGNIDKTLIKNMLYKPYTTGVLLTRIRKLLDENNSVDILSNRTVLVLDDEESIQILSKINLEKCGCKVISVFNGEDAIDSYKNAYKSDNPIDVLIVDLTIPGGVSGVEVTSEIRKINSQAKVIVSSGYSEGPEMTNPQGYGFDAALEKNFDHDSIKRVLERVLKSDPCVKRLSSTGVNTP